jgi:hypothetical protein
VVDATHVHAERAEQRRQPIECTEEHRAARDCRIKRRRAEAKCEVACAETKHREERCTRVADAVGQHSPQCRRRDATERQRARKQADHVARGVLFRPPSRNPLRGSQQRTSRSRSCIHGRPARGTRRRRRDGSVCWWQTFPTPWQKFQANVPQAFPFQASATALWQGRGRVWRGRSTACSHASHTGTHLVTQRTPVTCALGLSARLAPTALGRPLPPHLRRTRTRRRRV